MGNEDRLVSIVGWALVATSIAIIWGVPWLLS